jgi:sugar lactone lactonase YvrE
LRGELLVDCRNQLGEGCFWDPRDASLWWTDIERSCVYRRTENGEVTRHQLPGRAGFILPRSGEGFVIGFPKQIVRTNSDFSVFEKLHDVEVDLPQTRSNDATVDPYGGVVFGTFDETHDMAARRPIASLYRLSPDGKLSKLLGDITTSNGLAFSPDGEIMHFADTAVGVIRRFRVESNFSSFEEISPLADADVAAGRPDGGTVDADGNYWSARVWGGCAVRFDPQGRVTAEVKLPTKGPTCVALGSPDLKTLFITTLRIRHTAEELEASPSAGGIFQVRVDVAGAPQRLCDL